MAMCGMAVGRLQPYAGVETRRMKWPYAPVEQPGLPMARLW